MDALRPLGGTGLKVTALTLGTSYLGNPAQEDGSPAMASFELARHLLTGPFAAVDTSNNYAGGRSETVLGAVIAEQGGLDGKLVFTKADADPHTGHLDRDRVWRSFEESVARLGITRLPLFHLHDPFHYISFEEAFAPSGAVQGLLELKDQGLVGAIGIAAGETQLMRQYVHAGAFDAILTHNRYTLIDSRAKELINEASEKGMGIFNAAPFGGGLLAGKGDTYAYRQAPGELIHWVERLRAVCDQWNVEVRAAALHFSLRNPLIHSTIVGVNNPVRIKELDDLQHAVIPEGFWDAVTSLGSPASTLDD